MVHKGYNLYNGGLAFGLVGGLLYAFLYKSLDAGLKALQRQIFRFTMVSANPTGFLPMFFSYCYSGEPCYAAGY